MTEQYLTELHAEAVTHFLQDNRIAAESVDVVGFHGQTVLHAPERQLTVQIGDGPGWRRAIGIDVVYDLRAPMSPPAARARRWRPSITRRWSPSCARRWRS